MIESEMVTINNVVISGPRIPFWGIKNSAFFGRELSRYGMLEFVNIKSVRFYDQLVHGPYVERDRGPHTFATDKDRHIYIKKEVAG
jgi:succinate-semialdehyde dehydrogenase/glutarate-semialdehyde dehydrogenase/succinyl-CoA reductase